jgi:hypothetical protein
MNYPKEGKMSEAKWERINVVDEKAREGLFKATGELYNDSFVPGHQEDWENFAQYINFGKKNVKELCRDGDKEYIVENYIFSGLVGKKVAGMIYITAFHTAKKAVVWYAIINPKRAGAELKTLRRQSLFTLRKHLAHYDIIFELERIPFSDMTPVHAVLGEDIALVKAKYQMVKELGKSGVRKLSGVRYREPSLTDSPEAPCGEIDELHLSVYLGKYRNKPPDMLERARVIELLDLIYNQGYYSQSLATSPDDILHWRDHYKKLFEMAQEGLPVAVPLTPLYANNIHGKLMICYAEKDEKQASWVKHFIEDEGIEVDDWHATSRKYGDSLLKQLHRMIIESQYFVFLVTPQIFKAEGVHAELAQVSFLQALHEANLITKRRMPRVYFLCDFSYPSNQQKKMTEFLGRYFPPIIDPLYSSQDDLVVKLKNLCYLVRKEAQIDAAVLGFYTTPAIIADNSLSIADNRLSTACTKLGIAHQLFENVLKLKFDSKALDTFVRIINNSIKRDEGLRNAFIITGKLADICVKSDKLGLQLSGGNIHNRDEELEKFAEEIRQFKRGYDHAKNDFIPELTSALNDIVSSLEQNLERNKKSTKTQDLARLLKDNLINIPD